VARTVTRYGSLRRARAATLLLLGLPGTVFLYAGQELGLEEVDLAPEDRRDPVFYRTNGERLGRDGARVPIPWTREPPTFGFTSGDPWLPVPQAWADRSVEAQASHPRSTLALAKQAIAMRPSGQFGWRPTPHGSLAWERDGLVCVVNLDAPPVELPDGELVLSSDALDDGRLPTDTAAWVRP
jgi:alpha-glucosidase